MASKEAAEAPSVYAFELKLQKDKIGEKTTNKQVKAKVSEAFMGYGAFDECRVVGDVGADRTVTVFFARLFGKGLPAWEALGKGEATTVSLYDETIPLSKTDAKPSGGGATTGTSSRPKKEAKAGEKKAGGRGRGRGAAAGEEKKVDAEGKVIESKTEDKKDGGRGRGRGKKEEVKGPSLQRGRANIGGKLGPVSKVRLAKQAREQKAKEAKERADRGEKPLEDEKKEDDDDKSGLPPARGAAGKKEAGKKEGGKKEAGKKGDAPKGEAGKKDAGKKEAPKGGAAPKKGK